jgi:hypothetical protein
MADKPTYRGTRLRNIRIDDELWAAAQARAEAEGTTLSAVIRDRLVRYAAAPPKKARRAVAASE